jgi:hypothetical protein
MEKAKLLVIVITTAAIIAMATTTSLSTATPAFAKFNCTSTSTAFICTGGESFKKSGIDIPGGSGGQTVIDQSGGSGSGGSGFNGGTTVGGEGRHYICEFGTCTTDVGTPEGRGLHPK